jgi:hypothetical protein
LILAFCNLARRDFQFWPLQDMRFQVLNKSPEEFGLWRSMPNFHSFSTTLLFFFFSYFSNLNQLFNFFKSYPTRCVWSVNTGPHCGQVV